MAKVTSGSFDTGKYSDRYLVFSWSATQDTAKNQSTISWSLKGAGGSTTSYYMSAPFSVTIAGEEVYQSDTRIQLKNGTTVASGTKTITHKDDGTKSFSASVKAAIFSGSYNVSGSGKWDLTDIPRAAKITSASNFNDEGNPTIKYSNALGNGAETLQAAITLNQDGTGVAAAYRNITKTGTSYTFSLTDAERNILRNNCTTAKSRKVYFYIKTVIGGVSYTNNMEATLTIVNANPTLTAVVKDTGAASTALTGDNQKMIKGFNYVNVALTATGLKGATIKSYTITNGGNTVSKATGNFNNTEDNKFVCVVKDSRGYTTTITEELTMINYTKLTAAADISMAVNGSSSDLATLTVKLSGNYFNGSFGAVDNTLRFEIYEEQVETGLNYTGDKPISTFSGNTYSHTYTDDTLPYENSWKVRVRVYDKISSITLLERVVSAKPVFDWSDKDFNFNVPIYYSNGAKRKLFFEPGDSITFDKHELNIGGVNTNSGKDIYFTIPINKPIMAFGCNIEGDLMVRGIKGYVNTAGNTATNIPLGIDEAQTITVGFNDAGIMVKLSYASTVNSGANNTPVSISSYPITITFN
jgi:hypothetical protein